MSVKASITMGSSLYPIEFDSSRFPGGESHFRITHPRPMLGLYKAIFTLNFESNNDLFDLALLVDAVKRYYFPYVKEFELKMPYVPYARQDRVCNAGESLSVAVVASFINGLGFNKVTIVDPHSDVTPALFNNVEVIGQETFAVNVSHLIDFRNTVVVAPDAGASKKARKFAQERCFAGLVQAEKVRDLATGRILETKVSSEHIGDKHFLIVDDICDGGRTFTELAKVLRPLTNGKIMLYVTHGIFSAGEKVFDNLIDFVYTSNPVGATGLAAVASGKVVRI